MTLQEVKLENIVKFSNGKSPNPSENGAYLIFGSNGVIGKSENFNYENGVIIGRVGAYCGSVQVCDKKFWASDNTIVVKPIDNNNLNYIYYLLKNFPLRNFAGGSAQPLLTQTTLKKTKIKVFSVPKQKKIADILSKYDDLIENNRRRIELLEESARLLYREWFVHLRFPSHEYTPIIDGIPEGWEKKKLEDIADITMGQSPKSEYYNNEGLGLPFHQGVSDFSTRFPSTGKYCNKGSRYAEEGDILFSVRAPVGRINMSLEKIVIGRGLAAIRSKCNQQNFLFYQLKNYFFREDMIGNGSIFASTRKDDLKKVEILTPSDYLINLFKNKVSKIDNQIKTLYLQNQKLSQARDLLLPRLMNGEITV